MERHFGAITASPPASGHTCRACGSAAGNVILDLGMQPLANSLPRPEDAGKDEPKFPLRVFVCPDCWLLQITDLIPPAQLFSEYIYFSSFSSSLLEHARLAAERYRHEFKLSSASLVVEIASNDGYLLRNFQTANVPCLGIDPAANIAKVAREQGIETLVEFFGSAVAARLATAGRQADLILGNNVFAHVPAVADFLQGLKLLLKPAGRVILEFPYCVDMIEHTEFDTIYHEHVFYFTLTALKPLFLRHGLEIFHVERLAIHGGSLRLFAGHAGAHATRSTVADLLAEETAKGVPGLAFYLSFSDRVEGLKRDLLKLLADLRGQGRRIAAYGASAKGSTLLNYFCVGRETLEFVADRSTHKQGLLTPGTHIPIVGPGELARLMPDYTLLLTWNFAAEILQQQEDYRKRGGKFIVPIPTVKVI